MFSISFQPPLLYGGLLDFKNPIGPDRSSSSSGCRAAQSCVPISGGLMGALGCSPSTGSKENGGV